MIRQKKVVSSEQQITNNSIPILALQGFIVGILTGIIGAGGSFLIIPALVFLAKLSMKIEWRHHFL